MNLYLVCFRKCSFTLTCRLSRHSLPEGFFSTERSTDVSEDGMSLSHSGVPRDLTAGAVPVLASGNLSRETASAGPLPSTQSATSIPSRQMCKHEMKTTESVCSTPQILHIYKGKNTRWRKSTPIYPAYGVTSGISYGNIKRRQMALFPVFNSNLTTEGKGNKEFGLPWKCKQVSIHQLLTVSLPLLMTPVTCTKKLTWDKQWIMTNFTTESESPEM